MTYRLIEAERAQHPVSRLCKVMHLTRAGFCAWRRRGPSARAVSDAALLARIQQIHEESRGVHDVPRIHAELAEAGACVSRERIARLMRVAGLAGVFRRGKRRTTTPGGEAPAAPDLVKRTFAAEKPDRLWCADITYVPTWEGWLFLAAVVDTCSRYCVGWSMRDDLSSELVYDALGMAVTRR